MNMNTLVTKRYPTPLVEAISEQDGPTVEPVEKPVAKRINEDIIKKIESMPKLKTISSDFPHHPTAVEKILLFIGLIFLLYLILIGYQCYSGQGEFYEFDTSPINQLGYKYCKLFQ